MFHQAYDPFIVMYLFVHPGTPFFRRQNSPVARQGLTVGSRTPDLTSIRYSKTA